MSSAGDPRPKRLYHGTRAGLKTGDLISPGPPSDACEDDAVGDYVYFTDTFDSAAWQAELAPGDGAGRIYQVEPTGAILDDPDPAKYPVSAGLYCSRDPLRVTDECTDARGRPFRLYHGTKADVKPGDLIAPGYSPNFGQQERVANHVYFAGTLDAAIWGAELALGDGRGRVYLVEPTGPFEDDPNLTNAKFRGNPTKSYRSRQPLLVTGEITDWHGHVPETVKAMRDGLEELRRRGVEPNDD